MTEPAARTEHPTPCKHPRTLNECLDCGEHLLDVCAAERNAPADCVAVPPNRTEPAKCLHCGLELKVCPRCNAPALIYDAPRQSTRPNEDPSKKAAVVEPRCAMDAMQIREHICDAITGLSFIQGEIRKANYGQASEYAEMHEKNLQKIADEILADSQPKEGAGQKCFICGT